MAHAQNVAFALLEKDVLQYFVTSVDWRPKRLIKGLLSYAPQPASRLAYRQLSRKSIELLPSDRVQSIMLGEMFRLVVNAMTSDPIAADLAWDWASRRFDATVAKHFVSRASSIWAFEYTALASFEYAAKIGVPRILHLPSPDSREFEEIQRQEKKDWPELVHPSDAYFASKFEQRYARRRAEIELADVIIANSSFTAGSHIRAGADPAKVRVAPLGGPPPIDEIAIEPGQATRALKVIWAGPFSLRKGAHYLCAAWRHLNPGRSAFLDIYGKVTLPERALSGLGENVRFHGARPQSELFSAYQKADVLVFPTLFDGYGMVVAEAFAFGLPVISTDQAGSSDLITPENGLIVPAGDAKCLAEALCWCLDNRDRLAAMRQHALETSRRRQWADFRRDVIGAVKSTLPSI
jgi:glycosyltransferase involved in cell wall biosynthesis